MLDNITISQVKEILAMFGGLQGAQPVQPVKAPNPVVGQYCIARCYAAGVHAGIVVSVDGSTAVLKHSRRLWSWTAQEGIALSGVAQHGIKAEESKLDTVNPIIYLTEVCELIPCSMKAMISINGEVLHPSSAG